MQKALRVVAAERRLACRGNAIGRSGATITLIVLGLLFGPWGGMAVSRAADVSFIDSTKPRLIILTDMGNEPDDSQTMVHLLMYANELDIEGLIAVSSRWLNPHRDPPKNRLYPELIEERVAAYAKVLPNLRQHADGWPDAETLRARIAAGQPGYGMEDVGDGHASPGSELIIRVVDRPDPRPVWIAINAGSNTLAQALWDIRKSRSPEEVRQFIAKIHIYDDAGQDNAGAWICHEFPEIDWRRSYNQVFCLYGSHPEKESRAEGPYTWEPYSPDAQGQHAWAKQHIQTGHGPLGALYPDRFGRKACLEGGGTTTWIGLVNRGLYNPFRQDWGGWGGRFTREKQLNVPAKYQPFLEEPYKPYRMYAQTGDTFTGEGITGFDRWCSEFRHAEYNPIWKWRRAYMNEFAARMDWCVQPREKANHNPVAAFGGDMTDRIVVVTAEAGEVIDLDARESRDPDGDPLEFCWFYYPDPGTYSGQLEPLISREAHTSFRVPRDAAGSELHVVLQVHDRRDGDFELYDYRRVVIRVTGEQGTK
ncbi:MAG: DUF1593 domain-containing protein [Planctomycetota bacterium]|nr:MAG: DUF1593 domain-containing protein [Planctomycetota bacterium]